MSNKKNLSRRDALGLMAVAGIAGFAGLRAAQVNAKSIGAMMPGKGWLKQGTRCEGDGTPLQFIPKTAPDPDPLTDELKKYPKCPYCGMDRTMWNHSRHLVHYDDDLVDGTCSIHCLAISLALNLDRGIRAIYAADFGAADKPKPLINVDKATYLIGSSLKGTMTKKSKMALASAEKARAVQAKEGGELGRFDDALRESYLSMANDTMMIRQRRADKRKKMMMKKKVK
ncbi:MAG TPA: twin-arginine translocation pathway signal protein [Deltaproteobacteria bacterium]|nr:twin-arginine translocation pathway signal protein [Deltaproteobacteria bacterium]